MALVAEGGTDDGVERKGLFSSERERIFFFRVLGDKHRAVLLINAGKLSASQIIPHSLSSCHLFSFLSFGFEAPLVHLGCHSCSLCSHSSRVHSASSQ